MNKNKKIKFKDDDLFQFLSFFYQQKIIKDLKKKNILEIGIGNKFLTNYLKSNDFQITTCDLDQNLNPDYVADIRKLPFENNSFDLVVAFEVLEHLPFADFEIACQEMRKTSREYVVISLPYSSIFFSLTAIFPLIRTIFKKRYFNFFLKIPQFFRSNKYDGEHFWEMGRRGTSKNKIRKILKKYYKIEKEFQPLLNFYHYFFVLKINKK